MSKYTFLLFAGLFIGVLPYLGFPSLWDTIMFTLGGLSVAVVSVLVRLEHKKSHKDVVIEKQPAYVESNPPRPRRPRPIRPKNPRIEVQSADSISSPPSVHTEAE